MILPETNLRGTYSLRQKHILKIKQMMRALGFNEVINYFFNQKRNRQFIH